MYVGGGQGMTHGKKETFPYLAKAVAFVSPEEVVSAAEAVVKLFRDHGNRADRKRARLKYLMADWGVEKFRDVFAKSYFQKTLLAPRGLPITGLDLHHGWHPQGNGKWFLGLSVENGRVKDEGAFRLRTGLRTIVSKYRCAVRITPQQDVLVCDVAVADKAGVDSLLNEHGIPRPENLSLVRKWGMACPAIPTCPLALTESERVLPEIIDHLETTLAGLDLAGEPISVRMTGCPNGCARPYQSEIGLVGRSGEKFTVFIGGDSFGRRMNVELKDLVPKGEIVPLLGKVFAAFKAGRAGTESFGDFCDRVGIETLRGLVHG
jgi:sulfite reductase (ferredoxin)